MKTLTSTLTKDQLKAFDYITTQLEEIIKTGMVWDNVVALNGPAGSGKTYLLTSIIKYLLSKEYSITITTPTHKALSVLRKNLAILDDTILLKLKTIHSFLNIRQFTDYTTGEQKFKVDKTKKDKDITDILIVDESSMVSEELYGYIIDAIEEERVKAVLFVGDKHQLLPVDEKKQIIDKISKKVELNEIVRQAKDSYIINVATMIRKMIKTNNFLEIEDFLKEIKNSGIEFFHSEDSFYNSFANNKNWWDEDKIVTSYRNYDVNKSNNTLRARYWYFQGVKKLSTFLSGDKLIFQSSYIFKDRVIYNNGDIVELKEAKLKHLDELGINYWECSTTTDVKIFIVDTNSKNDFDTALNKMAKQARIEKNYKTRKEMWEKFYSIKELFADVKYIYASTIHKLQGSTYESVYIDFYNLNFLKKLSKEEFYRLFYVAITRASKDVKILIPNIFDDEISLESLQKEISKLFGGKILN